MTDSPWFYSALQRQLYAAGICYLPGGVLVERPCAGIGAQWRKVTLVPVTRRMMPVGNLTACCGDGLDATLYDYQTVSRENLSNRTV
jgi:hypothetical protein